MKLRNVVAVAALAVVGVVGSASAQWALPGSAAATAKDNNLVGDKAVAPVEMHVTYKVELKAEMVGFGPALTGVDLKELTVEAGEEFDPPANAAELMKFGLLQVTTNYPGWDIGLTTRSGGILTTDGGKKMVYDTSMAGTFPNLTQVIDSTLVDVAGDPLKAAGGAAVPIVVSIGVVDLTDQSSPTPLAHTIIDPAALLLTSAGNTTAGAGPLSFVKIFSTAATVAGNTQGPGAANSDLNGDVSVGGRDLGNGTLAGATTNLAYDLGFGPTELNVNSIPTVPPPGAVPGQPLSESELFYISVKMSDATIIAGNPEGEYSETFTFTMYAAY